MTTSSEMILVCGTVGLLKEMGSWGSETHIQKTVYIAQQLKDVPFESQFILYKHGPFSFDLNKSLVHMRSRGLLSLRANPGYGPSFSVNETLLSALNKSAGNIFEEYETKLRSVCSVLAKCNVAQLERLATAVYLNLNRPELSDDERAVEMTRIKSHILLSDARESFKEARALGAD